MEHFLNVKEEDNDNIGLWLDLCWLTMSFCQYVWKLHDRNLTEPGVFLYRDAWKDVTLESCLKFMRPIGATAQQCYSYYNIYCGGDEIFWSERCWFRTNVMSQSGSFSLMLYFNQYFWKHIFFVILVPYC